MRSLLRIFSALMVAVMLFCLSACGKGNSEARIYVALPEMPETLDPQVAKSDSELLIARNIYEGLTRKNENGDTVLAAAKEYNYSDKTYTFILRDGLRWESGEDVTAADFVFGLKRALLPETQAPFARLLYSIKGAKAVNTGAASPDTLGVSAVDSKTLKIELESEESEFLSILSYPVAMPCNQSFFSNSAGRYGLEKEFVLSNGSYKLAKWNKTDNGIRLYKNENYNGDFKPQNGGIFISKDKEKTVAEKLTSGESDIALLPTEYLSAVSGKNIKTVSVENICWVLSLGGEFTPGIRQALCMSVRPEIYAKELPQGMRAADSFFPGCLGVNAPEGGFNVAYDSVTPQTLINSELKNYKNKKLPQTTLIYSRNESIKPAIISIVGDWQNSLGTFINIKPADKSLESEITDHSLSVCIFPITADSTLKEYLMRIGAGSGGDIASAFGRAVSAYNLLPIAFEDTTVGYLDNISGVYMSAAGGYIDFSFVVKK
ncbi:MAG: hypothetical protein IKZ47_02090 [Clostridia bacterium]|nr:hypothetical protein [Clostridia bacterium]